MAGNMTGILSKTRCSYRLLDGSLPLNLITRRGYSATVSQAEAEARSIKAEAKAEATSQAEAEARSITEEQKANSVASETSSWVPDPVTGYYKPSAQVDVREGSINKKQEQEI